MKRLFILLCTLFCAHLAGGVLVTGDPTATTPNTFASAVVAKVFDRASGSLFVGLAGANNYTLSRIDRPVAHNGLKAVPLANTTPLNTLGVEFLALATSSGNTNPTIALVQKKAAALTSTTAFAISPNGKIVQPSSPLIDASAVPATTAGIVGITASKNMIFAALKPAGGNFGANVGDIASIAIDPTTLALTQKDAQNGSQFPANIKAKRFTASNLNLASFVANTVAMHWDDVLQVAYVSLIGTTAATGNGKSVFIARVDSDPLSSTFGKLTFPEIVADGDIATDADIVAAQTAGLPLSALHLRTMHTSTGNPYLIVNGGNDAPGAVNNQIYALPLNADGTLTIPLLTSGDIPAVIGGGPLPIEASTPIADIDVVGDTVYVAINVIPDATNDTGVLYSQAIFDNEGKVAAWTAWAQRATPFDVIPEQAGASGPISFFSMDAKTGKSWSVEGTANLKVAQTQWSASNGDASLITQLNKHLKDGCYSVLDLHQDTRGLSITSPIFAERFAAFGGNNKIIFARTSIANDAATTERNTPQTVILNYLLPENFVITTLPENAGCVTSLEYSRLLNPDPAPNPNFYFAGTQNGLYVAATTDLIWQKFTALPEKAAVLDIKSSGQALYVLTVETDLKVLPTNQTTPIYRIYKINLETFAVVTIAESGVTAPNSDLSAVKSIANMQIIFDTADSALAYAEQLVMTTNAGLYVTQEAAGVQDATVIDQETATWQPVNKDTSLYLGMTGVETQLNKLTIWPWNIKTTPACERCLINQMGSSAALATLTNVPQEFNATLVNGKTNPAFATFDIITNFWTDGARRFFVINKQNDGNHSYLLSLPFNTQEWNIKNQISQIITDKAVKSIDRIYWVNDIGATGIVMLGTNRGVVGLV